MNNDEVILILCEVILIDEHQDNKISIQLKIYFHWSSSKVYTFC